MKLEEIKELKIKDENYFQISGWMVNKLGLKGNTLMVYAIIYGFSQDGESYFSGSRKYLCDFIGATKPTIDKSLQELIEKNYIFKYSEKINDITHNKYKINLDVVNFTSGKETLLGGKEIAPNNKEYNIDINTNNINTIKENIKEKKEEELEIISKIFDFWNSLNIIKHSKLNETRIKAIKNRLKEYPDYLIMIAMRHYEIVLHDSNSFWNYTWSLEDFLNRKNGFTTFLDDGSNWVSYEESKSRNSYSSKKEVSKETAYPEHKDENYW